MLRAIVSMLCVVGAASAQSFPPLAPNPPTLAKPVPAADEPVKLSFEENLVRFNPQDVQVVLRSPRWLLVVNNATLKDFGPNERDARDAQRVIRDYNLDAMGSIDGAQPPFEYWLSQGRPPTGGFRGMAIPFRREKVRAEKVSGVWCVRDEQKLLWNFGPDDLAAKRAAEVVREYAFDLMGLVGNPPKMVWMVRDSQREEHLRMLPASEFDRSVQMLLQNQLVIPKPIEPLKSVGDRLSPRVAPNALAETVVVGSKFPIDIRRVESRREKDGWRVVSGDTILATFPRDDGSARQLTAWLQDNRASEVARVGRNAVPIFLSGGLPLRASTLTVPTHRYKLNELRIARRDEQWVLRDSEATLFEFGDHKDDAEMMMATIRHLNLTTILRFGNPPDGGLSVLARDR